MTLTTGLQFRELLQNQQVPFIKPSRWTDKGWHIDQLWGEDFITGSTSDEGSLAHFLHDKQEVYQWVDAEKERFNWDILYGKFCPRFLCVFRTSLGITQLHAPSIINGRQGAQMRVLDCSQLNTLIIQEINRVNALTTNPVVRRVFDNTLWDASRGDDRKFLYTRKNFILPLLKTLEEEPVSLLHHGKPMNFELTHQQIDEEIDTLSDVLLTQPKAMTQEQLTNLLDSVEFEMDALSVKTRVEKLNHTLRCDGIRVTSSRKMSNGKRARFYRVEKLVAIPA